MDKSECLVRALGSIDVADAAASVKKIRETLQLAQGVTLSSVVSTHYRRHMVAPKGGAGGKVDVYKDVNWVTRQVSVALSPNRYSRERFRLLDEAVRGEVNGGDDSYRDVLFGFRGGRLGPESSALVAALRRFVAHDVLNPHLLVGLVVRNAYFDRYRWYFALLVVYLIDEARANVLWSFDVQTTALESFFKKNPRGALHGLSLLAPDDAIKFFFRPVPGDHAKPDPFGRIPLHFLDSMLRLGSIWTTYVEGWPWYQFFLDAALLVVERDGWAAGMRSKTPAGEQLIAVLWLSDSRFRTQHRLDRAIVRAIEYNNIEGAVWCIACYENSDELVSVARGNQALVHRLVSRLNDCLTVYPLLAKLNPGRLLGTIDVLVTLTTNACTSCAGFPITHILVIGWSLILHNVLVTYVSRYLRLVSRIMWHWGVHTGALIPKMYTLFIAEIRRSFPVCENQIRPALAIYRFPPIRNGTVAEATVLTNLIHMVCSFDPHYWTRATRNHWEAESRRRFRSQFRTLVVPQYVWHRWRGVIEEAVPAMPSAHRDPAAFLAITTRGSFPFEVVGMSHGVRAKLSAIGPEEARLRTVKLVEQRLGRSAVGLPVLPYEIWGIIYMWVVRLTVASSDRLTCYGLSL